MLTIFSILLIIRSIARKTGSDQESSVARSHWLSCFVDLEKIQKISHILRKRNSQTSAYNITRTAKTRLNG